MSPHDPRDRRRGRDQDYTGPERRDPRHDLHNQNLRRFQEIEAQMAKFAERLTPIELELRDNTTVTKEVRELMELGRYAFKFFGWIYVFGKWAISFAAAVVAAWGVFQTFFHIGGPPGRP